jgi:hypothetical protein
MRQHLILIFVCFQFFLFTIQAIDTQRTAAETGFKPAQDSIDLLFENYRQRASVYLSRPIFQNTPMTAEMMTNCARNTWQKYGTLVPVELALAQAQLETRMGTGGRSGHRTNPYNLGEWADRTTLWFKTTEYGVQAYYDLLARRYITGGKTVEDMYTCFIDKDGFYYAPPDYGPKIKVHVMQVKHWIDSYLEKTKA